MRCFNIGLVGALAVTVVAGSAHAQSAQPAPPSENRDILVTGPQPNTGLVVDVERIALNCAACRRALVQLQAAAASARQQIRYGRTEIEESRPGASGLGGVSSLNGPSVNNDFGGVTESNTFREVQPGRSRTADAILAGMRARSHHARMAPVRRDMAQAASPWTQNSVLYLRNLMRYVAPIVERHRRERNVQTVYRPGQRPGWRRLPNITDQVIQELDRNQQAMNLLEGIDLPAPPRR